MLKFIPTDIMGCIIFSVSWFAIKPALSPVVEGADMYKHLKLLAPNRESDVYKKIKTYLISHKPPCHSHGSCFKSK